MLEADAQPQAVVEQRILRPVIRRGHDRPDQNSHTGRGAHVDPMLE